MTAPDLREPLGGLPHRPRGRRAVRRNGLNAARGSVAAWLGDFSRADPIAGDLQTVTSMSMRVRRRFATSAALCRIEPWGKDVRAIVCVSPRDLRAVAVGDSVAIPLADGTGETVRTAVASVTPVDGCLGTTQALAVLVPTGGRGMRLPVSTGAAVRLYRSVTLSVAPDLAGASAGLQEGEGPFALYEQEQGRARVRLYGPVSAASFRYTDDGGRLTAQASAVRGIVLSMTPLVPGTRGSGVRPIELRFGVVPGGSAFRLGVAATRPTLADARCLTDGDTVFNRGTIGPCEFGSAGYVWVESPDSIYPGEELIGLIGHAGAWGPGSTLRQTTAEWTVTGPGGLTTTGPAVRVTTPVGTPVGQEVAITVRVRNERGTLLSHTRRLVTAVHAPPPPATLPRIQAVEERSPIGEYRYTYVLLDPVPAPLTVVGEAWTSGPSGAFGAWQPSVRLSPDSSATPTDSVTVTFSDGRSIGVAAGGRRFVDPMAPPAGHVVETLCSGLLGGALCAPGALVARGDATRPFHFSSNLQAGSCTYLADGRLSCGVEVYPRAGANPFCGCMSDASFELIDEASSARVDFSPTAWVTVQEDPYNEGMAMFVSNHGEHSSIGSTSFVVDPASLTAGRSYLVRLRISASGIPPSYALSFVIARIIPG